jgi:DNA-binding NtrC family response regulator
MHKILLIEPNPSIGKNLSSILNQPKLSVHWAQDEEEIRSILYCHEISLIIIEPLMSLNALRDDSRTIQNAEIGGVGLFLLNTIKKNRNKVKVLINSVVPKTNLLEAGFPKTCVYMLKTEPTEKFVEKINELVN